MHVERILIADQALSFWTALSWNNRDSTALSAEEEQSVKVLWNHRCYILFSLIKEERYVKSMQPGGKKRFDVSLNIPIFSRVRLVIVLSSLSFRIPLAHVSVKKTLMICFGFLMKTLWIHFVILYFRMLF